VASVYALVRRLHARSGTSGWTGHDLRRTCRSGLAALGVAPPVAEYILGHLQPKIQRTYNTYEPIREASTALELWARRLDAIVSGQTEAATVALFRGGAQ
jgi:integrase